MSPRTDPDNFISHKGFPALNIQVTGDTHHLIRDISVKWYSSKHDGRDYRNSKTRKLIERQDIFALATDSAYLISRTVVKPYPQANRPTESHKYFNLIIK